MPHYDEARGLLADVAAQNSTLVAASTHAAPSKATPDDADEIPMADSASSFSLKKLTWANLKATLATWLNGGTLPVILTSVSATSVVVTGPLNATGNIQKSYVALGTAGAPVVELGFTYGDANTSQLSGIWFRNSFASNSASSPIIKASSSAGVITDVVEFTSDGLLVWVPLLPPQAPTAGAPAYVKGGMYFDTTLNKMRIGGATAWETVTSV